ncbi:MAG: hypothetical protein AAF499_15760, partial [Pseudomonadota bacterium]
MSLSRSTVGWSVCAAFALTIVWFEIQPDAQIATEPVPAPLSERQARLQTVVSPALKAQFDEHLSQAGRTHSHPELVAQVEHAVSRGDPLGMARALHELGLLAIAKGDLDGADVWLADALAEYDAIENERGRAEVMLDIGRLHMAFRERAQRAAFDYDDLLLARWAMAHGYRDEAERALEEIVSSSLQLDRYGTAASALGSLFELHQRGGNRDASLQAGQRALALHASAGNLHGARRMLDALREQGLSRESLRRAEATMQVGFDTFEAETQKLGLVRDYTQLYHQLMARGDPVGAWRYRRQAEELRSSTSRRAMYRRQPDVIVELYRSNRSIDRAASVLRDAESAFA